MPETQKLIDLNIAALQEGQRLLSILNPSQYSQGFKPAFQSNIGTHFRHLLEHYRCFLSQLERCEFRYDKRERDQRLETDMDYAKDCIDDLIKCLSQFDIGLAEQDFTIAEQLDDAQQENAEVVSARTTLARELLFLQSHTVHHYAMIAAMCRGIGISPEAGFGVAIPTRNYTQTLDKRNEDKDDQESLCAQ